MARRAYWGLVWKTRLIAGWVNASVGASRAGVVVESKARTRTRVGEVSRVEAEMAARRFGVSKAGAIGDWVVPMQWWAILGMPTR